MSGLPGPEPPTVLHNGEDQRVVDASDVGTGEGSGLAEEARASQAAEPDDESSLD